MRCQALLSMKLFKLKMRETKEMLTFMQTFFNNTPQRDPAINSSPNILSTPSPISPTSSPAGGSSSASLVNFTHTPSPHHPNHHPPPVTAIPRTLYIQMQKHCGNALYVALAHDTWEQADALVAKHRVEGEVNYCQVKVPSPFLTRDHVSNFRILYWNRSTSRSSDITQHVGRSREIC